MAENLTAINSHLIGVSFIQTEENKQLRNQWDTRFREENADWIQINDPNPTVTGVLEQIVSLRSAQGQSIAGLHIVLTGFYDMFQEHVDQQAEFLKNLASELQMANAIMRPVIQFAYVGKNPSPDAEMLRQRVTMVASKSVGKLCMVGRSATVDGKNCWKPEMLLLDTMRRSQNPLSLLPLPNRIDAIGYVRYAEHSQSQIQKAEAEVERLKKCLGDDGKEALRAGVRACIDEIAEKALTDFPVDGSKQPLHPDMAVNPNKFHFTGRYKKMFEAAQRETVNAVHTTGSRLVERMKERYILSDEAADEMMRQIIAQRQPGYGLLETLQPGQLNLSVEGSLNSSVVNLPYSSTGYSEMITQYLVGRREDGVLMCQQAMLQKLMDALVRVRPEYTGKIEALREELKIQEGLKKKMKPTGDFLQDVTSTGYLLSRCFTPTKHHVSETRQCLLWRDPADRELVTQAASTDHYFIDREKGQLKNVDEFQLKMLEIYFAEATAAVADDLIREAK